MTKLRNSKINEIISRLERGEFCIEDFDISFPANSVELAIITFKPYPKYSFRIEESYEYTDNPLNYFGPLNKKDKNKTIKTIEEPGDYKNYEKNRQKNIDDCISRISNWVNNIHQDLLAAKNNPVLEPDEIIENFQETVEQKLEDPENFFDKKEQEEIRNQLDDLKDRVTSLEKQFNIPAEDTNTIISTIEKSKEKLEQYPKGVWYKTTGTKILKTLKTVLTSKEGREFLLEMGKNLLK